MQKSSQLTQELYLKIFFALVALTVLTFLQPFLIGNTLSTTVSMQMFIAVIKAIIIVAYYMHLKYESTLFKAIVFMAVITLIIFFVITATDAIFRNESFDFFS